MVAFTDSDVNKLGARLVKPNGTATEPAAPTKKDVSSVEGQLGGKEYDFRDSVTKAIALLAKWRSADSHGTAVGSMQLEAVRAVRNSVGEALELEGMERAALLEVYSMGGARVHVEALRRAERVVIDAQVWANGAYVVRVVASNGVRTLRVGCGEDESRFKRGWVLRLALFCVGPTWGLGWLRSRGPVFQTVSPFRQESEGLKTPAIE